MSKFDSLLKKAELFEKLAIYGDRKTFLEALGQTQFNNAVLPTQGGAGGDRVQGYGAGGESSTPANIPPPPPPSAVVAKPPHFTTEEESKPLPTQSAPLSYPSVSKETQDQLNALLVPSGNIFPLKADSKLGPKTQKAMEIFKAKFNMPATPQNIKQVYERENSQYTTKPGFENKNPI